MIQAITNTIEEKRRDFIPLTVFGSFLSLEHMGKHLQHPQNRWTVTEST